MINVRIARKIGFYFTTISIIISLICIFYNKLEGYNLLFLMPLTYALVCLVFFYMIPHRYTLGPIFMLANIVCFMKYSITALSIIIQEYFRIWGNEYGMWGPTPSDEILSLAIIIDCGEILAIYLTYLISIRRFCKKNVTLENKNIDICLFKNKSIIILFCLCAFIYIIFVFPEAFSLKSIIRANNSLISEQIQHKGIIVVFKQIFLITMFLLLEHVIYKKIYRRWIKIFFSYAILLIYISMNMSYSRWDILFAFLSGNYILFHYYGKRIFAYIFAVIPIIFIGFIAITRAKFNYSITEDAGVLYVCATMFAQMQDYFSGPRLVAQSIEVADMFSADINVGTIVNDLFGNVPLVSEFVNQNDRMNRYFCYYNFGNWNNKSLLIPMIGEGFCYFRYMPYFLSIFYSWLVVLFDINSQKCQDLEFKYLYVLEGCWLAFAICLNSQTNWGHFIQVFVMTWFVFAINKKCVIKR